LQLQAEFRQAWLDALRSPEWEGRECYAKLCDGEGSFCALGLAAHVHGVELRPSSQGPAYEWLERQVPEDDDWYTEPYRVFDTNQSMTFAQFADWLEANSEVVE
jgi:hypothetical protein